MALVSDVEKPFHQVSIAPNVHDVLRFLWIDNPVLPQPRVTVYCYTTIAHHIKSYSSCDPGFVEKFLSSLYVDDFSGGAGTTAGTYELCLKTHNYMFRPLTEINDMAGKVLVNSTKSLLEALDKGIIAGAT